MARASVIGAFLIGDTINGSAGSATVDSCRSVPEREFRKSSGQVACSLTSYIVNGSRGKRPVCLFTFFYPDCMKVH